MQRLSNQIVMKLTFRARVAALIEFESYVHTGIQNQKSGIGQSKPSAPEFSRRKAHFTIAVPDTVVAVPAEQ